MWKDILQQVCSCTCTFAHTHWLTHTQSLTHPLVHSLILSFPSFLSFLSIFISFYLPPRLSTFLSPSSLLISHPPSLPPSFFTVSPLWYFHGFLFSPIWAILFSFCKKNLILYVILKCTTCIEMWTYVDILRYNANISMT